MFCIPNKDELTKQRSGIFIFAILDTSTKVSRKKENLIKKYRNNCLNLHRYRMKIH